MEDSFRLKWKEIGCIAWGDVARYFEIQTQDGKRYAAKEIAHRYDKEKQAVQDEVTKLVLLPPHPNFVTHYGISMRYKLACIIVERIPGGKTVASLLKKDGPLPESKLRQVMKQVLLGLEYLHKNGINHSRVKAVNILIDGNGCYKLADFSGSKHKDLTLINTRFIFYNLYWTAPESLLSDFKNPNAADIWSVGCTVIEMVPGKPPWSVEYPDPDGELFHKILETEPRIPDNLSDDLKDFLSKCLRMVAGERATASELLQHRFITGEYLETPLQMENSSKLLSTSENDITRVREPSDDESPQPKHRRLDSNACSPVDDST